MLLLYNTSCRYHAFLARALEKLKNTGDQTDKNDEDPKGDGQ